MVDRVAVIGAGSWGTAVAALASHNRPTVLWARRKDLADEINVSHSNQSYLPDRPLPEALTATASLEEAVADADLVVMGVPSHGFRTVLGELAPVLKPGVPVISLTKGVEQDTLKRMTEVIAEVLPDHPAGVLTGPNLAKEVLDGYPAATRRRPRGRSAVHRPAPALRHAVVPGVHELRRDRLRGRRRAQERDGHRRRHGRRPRLRRQHQGRAHDPRASTSSRGSASRSAASR